MGSTKINNVISSTSNILLAGGGISNIYTMTENTGSMLLCDGGSWIVMLKY
jgi:aspartate oxidase